MQKTKENWNYYGFKISSQEHLENWVFKFSGHQMLDGPFLSINITIVLKQKVYKAYTKAKNEARKQKERK